jgi:hypothetical protein
MKMAFKIRRPDTMNIVGRFGGRFLILVLAAEFLQNNA